MIIAGCFGDYTQTKYPTCEKNLIHVAACVQEMPSLQDSDELKLVAQHTYTRYESIKNTSTKLAILISVITCTALILFTYISPEASIALGTLIAFSPPLAIIAIFLILLSLFYIVPTALSAILVNRILDKSPEAQVLALAAPLPALLLIFPPIFLIGIVSGIAAGAFLHYSYDTVAEKKTFQEKLFTRIEKDSTFRKDFLQQLQLKQTQTSCCAPLTRKLYANLLAEISATQSGQLA